MGPGEKYLRDAKVVISFNSNSFRSTVARKFDNSKF